MNGTISEFALLIQQSRDDDGNVLGYAIDTKETGIDEETIFTILRMWLRLEEDKYYAAFKGQKP